MGGSNSRYASSSEISSSDSEESLKFEDTSADNNENISLNETTASENVETDAVLRMNVSLPTAHDMLNFNTIVEIEKQLDQGDIVALAFLLSDEKNMHTVYERLVLMINGGSRDVLSEWAKSQKDRNWENKFIEALCIIKNYNILKLLGYNKPDVIQHFLPNNPSSLHINKFKKCIYLICDNLGSKEEEIFLNYVRTNFQEKQICFNAISEYLEMYFLKWDIDRVLDLNAIKHIFKIMKEEHLYNLLDSILPTTISQQQDCTQENSYTRTREPSPLSFEQNMHELFISSSNVRKENEVYRPRDRPSTSFEIPQNSESLRELVLNYEDNLRIRKISSSTTSVDNNVNRRPNLHENQNLKSITHEDNVPKSENVYPIDEENPGIVLIINQESFYYQEFDPNVQHLLSPTKLDERIGSKKDRDHLCEVFENFGFKVFIEESINHIDIIERIKEVTRMVKKESSLFVCIMSHGDQGVVYGSNSCRVRVSRIQKIMSEYNKENLSGKPKILILQSCQGSQIQLLNGSDDEHDDNQSLATDGASLFRDMYTFWATVSGYAAIRNKKTGSWFIQALCNKMKEFGNKHHFADICTLASSEVTSQVWTDDKNNQLVMTPIVETTLLKQFYLPRLRKS